MDLATRGSSWFPKVIVRTACWARFQSLGPVVYPLLGARKKQCQEEVVPAPEQPALEEAVTAAPGCGQLSQVTSSGSD